MDTEAKARLSPAGQLGKVVVGLLLSAVLVTAALLPQVPVTQAQERSYAAASPTDAFRPPAGTDENVRSLRVGDGGGSVAASARYERVKVALLSRQAAMPKRLTPINQCFPADGSCGSQCQNLNDCGGQLICIAGRCGDDPDIGTHVCMPTNGSCGSQCRNLNDCGGQLICINSRCGDDPEVGTHLCSPL